MNLKPLPWVLAATLALGCGSAVAEPTPLTASEAYALPQPEPGLALRYGSEPRQSGSLRLPEGDGPFPVAIVIHGGCWFEAYDGSYMEAFAEAVTELGFAAWTIGFRRIGEEGGGWPNTFIDVGGAADHVMELSEAFPLDPERVIAVGHSAGGQLALWLAARHRLPPESPLRAADPIDIDGVLALAAAADLEWLSQQQTCGNAASRLLDGSPEQQPERYAQTSPMRLLAVDVPQVLINGELDRTWSEAANRYYAHARAAGVPVQRHVVPGAGHFELVVPDSPNWDEIVGRSLRALQNRPE